MPCYHSKPVWIAPMGKGRNTITFIPKDTTTAPDYYIPCNRCEGCKARNRMDWATRIFHESQLWDRNSFLTLTYDDDHLPEDGKINKRHIQKFIEKLRKKSDRKIRYYVCGEYGEKTHRAHYHAIIFNEDFLSSRYHFKINDKMYGNQELENIWGKGQVTISKYNHARGNYVAGYVTKKIQDTDTFSLMSRRPPIGQEWVKKHHDNLRRLEKVIIDGQELPIPRVYMQWLKGVEEFDHIKENLRSNAKSYKDSQLRAKKAHYLAKQSHRKFKV